MGDNVKSSEIIKETFNCRFIKIDSSRALNNIGKFSFVKFIRSVKLFIEVCHSLVFLDQVFYIILFHLMVMPFTEILSL